MDVTEAAFKCKVYTHWRVGNKSGRQEIGSPRANCYELIMSCRARTCLLRLRRTHNGPFAGTDQSQHSPLNELGLTKLSRTVSVSTEKGPFQNDKYSCFIKPMTCRRHCMIHRFLGGKLLWKALIWGVLICFLQLQCWNNEWKFKFKCTTALMNRMFLSVEGH